jgi:ABC-type transporter Mla subunit MlaD
LLFGWAKGNPMRRNQPYSFSMSFREASKLDVGTPVRMKGVQIGTVTKVVLGPAAITGERVCECGGVANACKGRGEF